MSQRPGRGPSDLSKNPPNGGSGRSEQRSYNQPSGGNAARGGQDLHLQPFEHTIIGSIMNRAKECGVIVIHSDVVAFVQNYASSMPRKMRNFNQIDVEQACAAFEAEYVPPQPQQQAQQFRAHQQKPSQNPDNLFGKLLHKGKKFGIPLADLIPYLKWFTCKEDIREIAENPSPEDVEYAFEQMVLEISPAARIIDRAIDEGVSRETIGGDAFSKLTAMKYAPQPGSILWAFKRCPPLRVLQRELCRAPNTCIVAGISFSQDGSSTCFTQKLARNHGYAVPPDPKFMVGCPAIVFIAKAARYSYVDSMTIGDVLQEDIYSVPGQTDNAYYDDSGDMVNPKLHSALGKEEGKDSRRDRCMEKRYMVPDYEGNLPFDDPELRTNHAYQAACNQTMSDFGGIPVSMCTFLEEQVAASSAAAAEAEPDQSLVILCYHGNCVKRGDKYKPCPDCLRHPGRKTIVDGWGSVVGYHQRP